MKLVIFILLLGVLGLAVFFLTKKNLVIGKPLPIMCKLFAMSPEERSVHQNRLKNIQQAGQLVRKTTDGFIFNVHLQKMSFEDLKLWMDNEEKCCSFLRIKSEVLKPDSLAQVTVVCPLDSRDEVMNTFGLNVK